jgi:hypothetical protein
MSFDLTVLALGEDAGDDDARRMLERCESRVHPEGGLDERIVGFYRELRAAFPDSGELGPESPWMSAPLDAGIDHVSMNLSFSPRSQPALHLIEELAAKYRLTIFDPQSSEFHHP